MVDWLRSLWENETVREVCRAVVVAALVCLLGLLGYDVVLDPRESWRAAQGTEGLTHLDGLWVGEDVMVGGVHRFCPANVVEVTQGGHIEPMGSYQPLQCGGSGPVGTSDLAGGTAGDVLCLTNVAMQTITISDTGILKLGADRTLGQHDSLVLWCDGTRWIEVAYSDN